MTVSTTPRTGSAVVAPRGGVEYLGIQYLRGIAAMMVVVFHLTIGLERMGYRADGLIGVSGGVDIFFIISGFVMWMTTRTRAIGPVAFWHKRIQRIVPLYWLVTTAMLAILLVAPSLLHTSSFDLGHVILSYLFIAARNPGKPAIEPLVFAGWTLNYEMFFYLVFGLALLLRPMWRLVVVAAFFVLLVAIGFAARFPAPSVPNFYTSTIMLEFVGGLFLGEWVHRRGSARLMPAPLAILFVLGGFAAMLPVRDTAQEMRWILFGLPSFAIVAGSLALEGHGLVRRWRALLALGDASYSLYLTQLMAMSGFLVVWDRLHIPVNVATAAIFCLFDMTVAVAVGLIVHRLVERPITHLLKRPEEPSAPASADPSAGTSSPGLSATG